MKTSSYLAGLLLIVLSTPPALSAAPQSLDAPNTPEATPLLASEPAAARSSRDSIEVPKEELYQLQKLKIQQELKDDLTQWAKARAWVFALILAAVGFFGVRALARELISEELKSARQASNDAQAAGALARESIKELRGVAANYKERVDSASDTATKLNSQLAELRSRIESEGERSIAAAELKVQGLAQQITEMQGTLSALSRDSERHQEIVSRVDERLKGVRESVRTEQAKFEKHGKVVVTLVPYSSGVTADQADAVTESLTEAGYRLSRAPWGYSTPAEFQGTMKIEYMPDFRENAETIARAISANPKIQFASESIRLVENARPLSNDRSQVVIFWE